MGSVEQENELFAAQIESYRRKNQKLIIENAGVRRELRLKCEELESARREVLKWHEAYTTSHRHSASLQSVVTTYEERDRANIKPALQHMVNAFEMLQNYTEEIERPTMRDTPEVIRNRSPSPSAGRRFSSVEMHESRRTDQPRYLPFMETIGETSTPRIHTPKEEIRSQRNALEETEETESSDDDDDEVEELPEEQVQTTSHSRGLTARSKPRRRQSLLQDVLKASALKSPEVDEPAVDMSLSPSPTVDDSEKSLTPNGAVVGQRRSTRGHVSKDMSLSPASITPRLSTVSEHNISGPARRSVTQSPAIARIETFLSPASTTPERSTMAQAFPARRTKRLSVMEPNKTMDMSLSPPYVPSPASVGNDAGEAIHRPSPGRSPPPIQAQHSTLSDCSPPPIRAFHSSFLNPASPENDAEKSPPRIQAQHSSFSSSASPVKHAYHSPLPSGSPKAKKIKTEVKSQKVVENDDPSFLKSPSTVEVKKTAAAKKKTTKKPKEKRLPMVEKVVGDENNPVIADDVVMKKKSAKEIKVEKISQSKENLPSKSRESSVDHDDTTQTIDTTADAELKEKEVPTSSRSRRVREAISYKLPAANKKIRQGDASGWSR